MDGHMGARRAREGRGSPSRDGEPPTRTHRHELVCGEGPARSVLRVGARTQESGPPAPPPPGTQESALRPLAHQGPRSSGSWPLPHQSPWSPGPEPPPPSDLGVQPSLRPWERPSLPGFLGSGAWPPLSHWLPCLPVRFRKPGAVQTQQRSRYCRPFLPFSRTASIHHGIAVIHEHQQHPRPPTSPTQGSEKLTTPPFCR